VPPFYALGYDSVEMDPIAGWELIREGQEPLVIEDRCPLPSWDSELRFALRRRFGIRAPIDDALMLSGANARFRVVTRLETARGLRSIIADHREVGFGRGTPVEVLIRPDSRALAHELALVTGVVVESTDGAEDPLAPTVPGSRVWVDRWTARLEGGRARLPLELTSFSATFRGWSISNALFHVDVADYPELDFEQAVCVYLNTDFPGFVAAVESGSAPETALLWDGVIRRIISVGLGGEFGESESWPDGSLGAQVASWCSMVFHGESREAVASMRSDSPSRFEAKIQSWARVASRLGAEFGR
jgi:hypothetical protein